MKYKILELNIGNPSLERAQRQCGWLMEKNYDIYILTETRNSKGCFYISDYMESFGYQVIFPKTKGNNLGVMILSRPTLKNIDYMLEQNDELYGRFIKCSVEDINHAFDLVGIYIPSRNRQENKILRKKRFCDICLEKLSNVKDNLVLCGDYNVVSVNHIPHYSVYFQWEYQFLQKLTDMKLIDAHEYFHSDLQEYSWQGRTGNGYRYDYIHVYSSMKTMIKDCHYIHETRKGERKITDHSGIYMEFDTEKRGKKSE